VGGCVGVLHKGVDRVSSTLLHLFFTLFHVVLGCKGLYSH
jgi:hypothetical protein